MSEMCFQVTTKVCATCNYWQNFNRKFDFAGKKPIRGKKIGDILYSSCQEGNKSRKLI